MKRLFDIVLSFTGLVCVSPALAIIALSIRLYSKGPVFYRARRVGRYGNTFGMFKFRTMVVGADKLGGSSTAETDPRITRVGRFLRKRELDELPQLINVLKGDMSLVGPRPEVEEYTRLYTEEERIILSVRPGMTDYASIEFMNLNKILSRSADPDTDYAENIRPRKNRLRVEYAINHSLRADLTIIMQTLSKIVTDKWNTRS